jgi:uncharacterized protein YdcH (DUF465 family)
MGGINMCDMEVMLKRLIIMRDEKKLEGKDWMHVLGTSQLDWACFLTQVQRQVRKHINEKFTISFDSASAFLSTANGLVYTHNLFTPKRWSYLMDKEDNMKRNKDKRYKKLLLTKEYLDKKVSQLTKDRKTDRSWDMKATLVRLKKQKLKIKEEIAKISARFNKLTKVK